jgi:hypothetical protein
MLQRIYKYLQNTQAHDYTVLPVNHQLTSSTNIRFRMFSGSYKSKQLNGWVLPQNTSILSKMKGDPKFKDKREGKWAEAKSDSEIHDEHEADMSKSRTQSTPSSSNTSISHASSKPASSALGHTSNRPSHPPEVVSRSTTNTHPSAHSPKTHSTAAGKAIIQSKHRTPSNDRRGSGSSGQYADSPTRACSVAPSDSISSVGSSCSRRRCAESPGSSGCSYGGSTKVNSEGKVTGGGRGYRVVEIAPGE